MVGGLWLVLVIPAIIAFIFGVWVFYNMVADVSERGAGSGGNIRCVGGCARTPLDLR